MKRSKRRKKNLIKRIAILLVTLLIMGGVYFYLKIKTESSPTSNNTKSIQTYTILENTDTSRYQEIVMYNINMNINDVAKKYYKNSIFWPYIFIANNKDEAITKNPLDIPKSTIIRIPLVPENYLNLKNPIAASKIKHLTDSILSLN